MSAVGLLGRSAGLVSGRLPVGSVGGPSAGSAEICLSVDVPKCPEDALMPSILADRPIAEVSTADRPNRSIADAVATGRSPHPKRKESGRGPSKGPPPVQHKWNGNASQDSILGNGREVPFEIPTRRVPNTSSPALSADAYMSPPPHGSNGSALPPTGSSKRDTTPTTSTTHRYHNSHQNSSRGGTPSTQRLRDERNGQMVLLSRASDSEPDVTSPVEGNRREDSWKDNASTTHISTATSRITHSGNNITRIELDGDVSVI
ncbi:hypothetical protein B9Z55_007533 [Caenorhabditis nigoni]|uniref:Uncharacterized protein n=1 Tax=Caenorhabditis nigoni TaxID=1611254 RepID=A0A2G5VA55_9PELO|nr:hypothetical protein B9Z55_007533 [Caenorhabditis nigoni]